MDAQSPYPARLDIDYPEKLNRATTFFRLILVIPIVIIISLLTATGNDTAATAAGDAATRTGGGIVAGLWFATVLMILFRQRYPRWWFDFALELERFGTRISSYIACVTDQYPSTVEEQSVHLEVDYPDVEQELSRGMPLIKWFLAIPHYIVMVFLLSVAILVIIIAWFAILFTGRYPKPLFNYVVGVTRWALRISAYAFLLATDRYPPFSLK